MAKCWSDGGLMLVNDYIFSTKVLVNDVIDFGKTSENFNGSELDKSSDFNNETASSYLRVASVI